MYCVITADLGYQLFNITVSGFAFCCIDHLHGVNLLFRARISFAFVTVKYQHQTALPVTGIVGKHVAKLPAGGIQIRLGGLRQRVPRKDHVVAVNYQVLLAGWTDNQLFFSRTVLGFCIEWTLDRTELPFHNGFQFFVIRAKIPGNDLGLFLF